MAGGAHELLPAPWASAGAMTRQRFVKLESEGTVEAADAQGERVLGVGRYDVSADEATDGKTQTVDVEGVAWVEAGAAVTLGDLVTTTAAGKAEPAASGDVPAGIAWQAATADGDLITVQLTPGLPAI